MKASMRNIHRLLGVFVAPLFALGTVASQAMAGPVLPEGTLIAGNPSSLLGYDAALNDYVAGGLSAVNDQNIEFLTDDFALGIDFGSDGLLRLWDNLGAGDDVFNYALQFSFTGLAGQLSGMQPFDVNVLTAGSLLFSIVDHDTFQLVLHNVQFASGFSHVDLSIQVDEPSMLALFAFGIVGVFFVRRARLNRSTEITP